MDVLSDAQYQVLGFVAACNRSGYNPRPAEVGLWRKRPVPAPAEYRTVQRGPLHSLGPLGQVGFVGRMVDSLYGPGSVLRQFLEEGTTRELVKAAESAIDHLVYLTWLETVSGSGDDARLRLTDLGSALLRDREREDATADDVSVVVLGSEDPLAYALLVGKLAAAGAGLLIDPYLKLGGLHMVVTNTQLTRVLVSPKTGKTEISAMRAHLDSRSLGRRVELREHEGLHDRYVFAEDKSVSMLGTSLNGVGKTTTAFVPIPSPARETLRDTYERLWEEVTLVGPQPVEEPDEDDDEASADDGDEATDASGDDTSGAEVGGDDGDEEQQPPQ